MKPPINPCLANVALIVGLPVGLFLGAGVFKLFAQALPYEKMKQQIAHLPVGIPLQQARERIDRGPETSCFTPAECRQKLNASYSRYNPNPALKVRGPVLVYRMSGVDHIHCLYFDEKKKLAMVAESSMRRETPSRQALQHTVP